MEKLCFNCTGLKHKASECNSTKTCQPCQGKHRTSLCEKNKYASHYKPYLLSHSQFLYLKLKGLNAEHLLTRRRGAPTPHQI